MRRACSLGLALLLVFSSSSSLASEYELEQAGLIISSVDAAALRQVGIKSTLDLLAKGRTLASRQRIARRLRMTVDKVTAWVALADLMRIRGIGPDVARLLTAAGVKTIAQLQQADPAATETAVREVNKKSHLSENPPGAESIANWVRQARALPVVLE